MIDNITYLPYPVLESIIKCLSDKDLEALSCVNKIIRYNIIGVSDWKDKIGFYIFKQVIQKYRRQLEHDVSTRWVSRVNVYGRPNILIGRTSYTDDKLAKIYIPIYPMNRRATYMDTAKKLSVLELKQDIKSMIFLDMYRTLEDVILNIDGIKVTMEPEYEFVINILIHSCERCVLQYKEIKGSRNPITECDTPVLEFIFKYTNYIKMYKNLKAKNRI